MTDLGSVAFTVPGPAVPERKRSRVIAGRAGRSDTSEAKQYKALVRYCAGQAMNGRPPLEGPLALDVTVYRLKPKSTPKRVTYPITRPDCSNYLKLLEDACNKLIWHDDAQLVDVSIHKRFDRAAWVEIRVETIESREAI